MVLYVSLRGIQDQSGRWLSRNNTSDSSSAKVLYDSILSRYHEVDRVSEFVFRFNATELFGVSLGARVPEWAANAIYRVAPHSTLDGRAFMLTSVDTLAPPRLAPDAIPATFYEGVLKNPAVRGGLVFIAGDEHSKADSVAVAVASFLGETRGTKVLLSEQSPMHVYDEDRYPNVSQIGNESVGFFDTLARTPPPATVEEQSSVVFISNVFGRDAMAQRALHLAMAGYLVIVTVPQLGKPEKVLEQFAGYAGYREVFLDRDTILHTVGVLMQEPARTRMQTKWVFHPITDAIREQFSDDSESWSPADAYERTGHLMTARGHSATVFDMSSSARALRSVPPVGERI